MIFRSMDARFRSWHFCSRVVNAAVAAGSDAVGGAARKSLLTVHGRSKTAFFWMARTSTTCTTKTPGSVAGVLLGVETVQEFQVLTNSYSAEFGRSSGGIINAIYAVGN